MPNSRNSKIFMLSNSKNFQNFIMSENSKFKNVEYYQNSINFLFYKYKSSYILSVRIISTDIIFRTKFLTRG